LTAPATADAVWARTVAEVVADVERGLTAAEVDARRRRFGPNELESEPPVPAWRRLVDQFRDPLVYLLLAAIVVSLVAWRLDDPEDAPVEALVIAAIVVANALLGFWQERRATAAVAALQQMAATRATVRRDGDVVSVANSELVPGDVVLLAEGDAVGADCRLVEAVAFQAAEAPLTGESEPVAKQTEPVPADAALGDRTNMAFNGTAVVRGRAVGVVVATGMATEIGRIASLLDTAGDDLTPLQRQVAWLGKALGAVVVVLAAIVVVAILATADVESAADVVDALVVGVSLAVAAVPEGLPAILTVVLALGVQRMAAKRAIVKQLSSVETLGSASVICTDKTGTLTRNEMTIVRVVTPSADVEITGSGYVIDGEVRRDGEVVHDEGLLDEIHLVVGAGSLANDASLRPVDDGRVDAVGDPTEAAFLVAERKLGLTEQRERRYRRVGEIPFNSERKLMSTIDRDHAGRPGGGDVPVLMVTTKGAPDVLLERCSRERVAGEVVALTEQRRAAILADVDRLADDALRTLAVAYRPLGDGRRADDPAGDGDGGLDGDVVDESIEHDLIHLGVVGIIDPPRSEAATAIDEARAAGVRVIMITGDHPRTAARIGEQLGIGSPASANDGGGAGVTGRELAEQSADELRRTLDERSVFARVSPEQKLRIVEALQDDGHVVAMTGDGVNDAPALRQADIGVAMGINGTEVSKEAADMILADDNFATILGAVREGREIFDDIRKFLRYLLASNAGEVLVMFIGVLAAGLLGLTDAADGLAVPLLATQILWINLVTDSALALALGIDPSVENVMDRPPRRIDDRVIDRSMVTSIAVIGIVAALAGLVALDLELAGGLLGGSGDIETARTMVFTTIVLAQVFNAFNARSARVSAFVRPFDNRLLWAAVAFTVAMQALVVHAPPLQTAFDTVALDATRWGICLALATTVLFAEEIHKAIARRR